MVAFGACLNWEAIQVHIINHNNYYHLCQKENVFSSPSSSPVKSRGSLSEDGIRSIKAPGKIIVQHTTWFHLMNIINCIATYKKSLAVGLFGICLYYIIP